MKRAKRKYTRRPKQDAPQSKSSLLKTVDLVLPPETINADMSGVTTDGIPSQLPYYQEREFTFNDLPLSRRMQVESIIKARKRLGLPDDSKERRLLAVKYFRGDRPR